MKRSTKRIIGNIGVGGVLAGIITLLVASHMNPNLLTNDSALTAEANAGTPIVQGPVVPKTLVTEKAETPEDIADARTVAIELGRPEAAWDKYCVAWELPEAKTKSQLSANLVTSAWLESHGGTCPDALAYPWYFVESGLSSGDGQFVVTLDKSIRAVRRHPR